MGLFTRISRLFKIRATKVIDNMENPSESLDYSLVELKDNLKKVNYALLEMETSKERLKAQRQSIKDTIKRYDSQAKEAIKQEREDLATIVVTRKQELLTRDGEVAKSLETIEKQIKNLQENQRKLSHQIRTFESKKEELKAIYEASKAQLRIKEMVTGVAGDLSNVGDSINRAENKIKDLQAHAAAIDNLVNAGVLEDALSMGKDDIDRELEKVSVDEKVKAEIEKLKQAK